MRYNKQSVGLTGLVALLLMGVSLVSTPLQVSAEAFPGLNGRIIFSDVNGFDLRSIKADGTSRSNVSSVANPQTDAEYSPDGTKIVYRQIVSSVDQVFVANADGSSPQQLTTSSDFSFTPSWSPDSTKIVFIREVSGAQRIYTMNADGSNIINLTNNSVDDYKASWSPDGSKIIYASDVSGLPEIFTMNPDGTNKTQLTSDGKGYRSPVYSPDGTKIAFIDSLAPSPIYTMNANGTNITELDNSSWAREVSWQPLTRRPSSSTPNPSIAVSNGQATVDIASMYTDIYEGIDKITLAVTSAPSSGTVTVDSSTGVITYRAKITASRSPFWHNLGNLFFPKVSAASAIDSFNYRICSLANSNLCANGTITLTGPAAPNAGLPPAGPSYLAWAMIALSVPLIWLGLGKHVRKSSTN